MVHALELEAGPRQEVDELAFGPLGGQGVVPRGQLLRGAILHGHQQAAVLVSQVVATRPQQRLHVPAAGGSRPGAQQQRRECSSRRVQTAANRHSRRARRATGRCSAAGAPITQD